MENIYEQWVEGAGVDENQVLHRKMSGWGGAKGDIHGRCGISAVGKLAPRSLAHICAKDLGADIPWSENISTFSNRGVSSDSRRIESWRLEARRIFTHSVILGASCARNLRARIPCAKVPTAENLCAENPSSILSPPPRNIPTRTYKSKPIFGT